MNLYLRYFDKETLVSNVEEALDFLHSIPEIELTPELEADIRDYVASDVFIPNAIRCVLVSTLSLSKLQLQLCLILNKKRHFVLICHRLLVFPTGEMSIFQR